MISLAAWMTVSMSALSKLRTTKRPRCAGGTGGAVGGGGGGGVGTASGGTGAGTEGAVRGPTDAGGSAGSVWPVAGGAASGAGGVISVGRGRGRCEAQPAATTISMSVATRRFILLRRRRQRPARRVLRNWGHAAPEARRRPTERNRLTRCWLLYRRRRGHGLSGRHRLRHRNPRRREGARRRLGRAGHRRQALIRELACAPRARQVLLTGHWLLDTGLRWRRPRPRWVSPADVDHAVRASDHDRIR